MNRDHWSVNVLTMAGDLLHEEKVHRDEGHPEVFWVEAGSRAEPYRVQTDGRTWCTCTCPNGLRNNLPFCKHTAAVMLLVWEGDPEVGEYLREQAGVQ